MRLAVFVVVALCLLAPREAAASGRNPWTNIWSAEQPAAWSFGLSAATSGTAPAIAHAQVAAPRVAAFEYSDAYRRRAKIHKIASLATLPLFGTEVLLGQSVYSNVTDAKKGAHVAVGAAIGGLFGVNTVTGVWNLWEARKDPNARTLRLVHGLLMLAADTGFAITPMVAPDRDSLDFDHQRSTHRAVALTSIGIATAGYLTMLIGR
jgi:hypothetical protein